MQLAVVAARVAGPNAGVVAVKTVPVLPDSSTAPVNTLAVKEFRCRMSA